MDKMDTPAISIQDLSFRYDGMNVFNRVNFEVRSGEYLGIIGPNGSGKTTLLRLMLGLLEPSDGTIKIFGNPATSRQAKRMIGYVPQKIAQLDTSFPATVQEVVESGRTAAMGFQLRLTQQDRDAIEEALRTMDITDLRNRRVTELSGGQRQRAFIARALAAKPRILILDEPTVGIDAASQNAFYAILEELNQAGMTVIFVSHDTHALMRAVKCLLCLQEGELCQCSPDELHQANHLEKHAAGQIGHDHSSAHTHV